jgi:glutathione S-transferase
MSLPSPVLLFDQPRAPNPRRLNVFLAEKGLDLPRREIDLMAGEHKTPDYLGHVGAAQVPALELEDGTVLTETQSICRYIEALHPEPNLTGRDALEQAVISMWQRRVEFGLFRTVAMCFRHTNPKLAVLEEQLPEWGEMNRGFIAGHLETLDRRLDGREWIAADRLTVADITALVAVDFMRIIRYPLPGELANLAAWHARIAARPSASA